MRGWGFCSRLLVCVLSFVGVGSWCLFVSLLGVLCVPGGVFCLWVVCLGVVAGRGWVARSRLLLRVFLFVCVVCLLSWVLVGVGLCAFARGWCGLVLVCVVCVGLCGFPPWFFLVVGFLACGFFVGVVRFFVFRPFLFAAR